LHVIFVSEKQEPPALKQASPSYRQGCPPLSGKLTTPLSSPASTHCHDSFLKTTTKQRKKLYKQKYHLIDLD